MTNNVNCKQMRFVIRNLIDVDDFSLATVPEMCELTGDYLDLILPGNGARNPFLMARVRVIIFPKEEGMMQHSYGRYFP